MNDKNKKNSDQKKEHKFPEDFEKTLLDVDLHNLDKKLQETLIFNSPFEEEKTKLHPEEVETRIFNLELEPENIENEKLVEVQSPPQESLFLDQQNLKQSPLIETLRKIKGSISSHSVFKGKTVLQVILEILGFLGLLFLLDVSIEAILFSSPILFYTLFFTVVAWVINGFYLFKRKSFFVGAEATLFCFMILCCIAVRKVGGGYPHVLSIAGQPLYEIFNLIFFVNFAFIFTFLLFRLKTSKWIKVLISIPLIYSCFTFIQNLGAGLFGPQVWNLEDTLLGSSFFQIIPLYYFRPPVFLFWFLSPLVLLFFIIQKILLLKKNKASLARVDLSLFTLLIFSFILAHLILLNHHVPNIFSLVKKYPLSIGRSIVFGSADSTEIKTISPQVNEKEGKSNYPYKMSSSLLSVKDEIGSAALLVRDQENHSIHFLTQFDLVLSEKGEIKKPLSVEFLKEKILDTKDLYLLIDTSQSMSSLIPLLERSIFPIFNLLNSKENFFLVPFADSAKVLSIQNNQMLKTELLRLFSYGPRNLSFVLREVLTKVKKENQKTIFLITQYDASLNREETKYFLDQFRHLKIKVYLFTLGEELAPLLKGFAEETGGRVFNFKEANDLSKNLLNAFTEALGEYQVRYKAKSPAPEIKITSPSTGSSISQNSFLVLKIISSAGFKIQTARLYIDDVLKEELLAGEKTELYFVLSVDELTSGSHRFKTSVSTDDNKEFFSEEVIGSILKE